MTREEMVTDIPGQSTLLVLPRRPLSGDEAAQEEVARICGLEAVDVRQRCSSGRPAVLLRSADQSSLALPLQRLRDSGHGAVVISDRDIRRQPCPLDARAVRPGPGGVEFLDEAKRVIATLPRGADLLLIATHLRLAGENPVPMVPGDPSRLLAERMYAEATVELARLLAAGREGLVIDVAWRDGPGRIRLRADRLNLGALGAARGPSAVQNLRALIDSLIERSGRVLLDLDFGRFQPPRVSPGPSGLADGRTRVEPGDEREAAFESYARFVDLAWQAGLFEPALATAPPPGIRWRLSRTGLTELPTSGPESSATTPFWLPPGDESTPVRPAALDAIRALGPPIVVVPLLAVGVMGLLILFPGRRAGIWPLPLLMAGLLLMTHGLALLARRRRIENVPTSRIRSAAVGLCELSGRARPGQPLRTPFSLMPCVYYEYRLVLEPDTAPAEVSFSLTDWLLRDRAAVRRNGAEVRVGHSGHIPFFVEDETGLVEVDPRGAIVEVTSTQTLNHIPFAGAALPPGTRATAWEKYIPVDYPLYVMGELQVLGEAETEEGPALARRLRELKRSPARMAAGDLNGDGEVDPAEWEDLVTDLRRHWSSDRRQATARTDRLVIGRTATTPFFYISERSEKKIVQAFLARAVAALAVGLLLATFAAIRLQSWSGRALFGG